MIDLWHWFTDNETNYILNNNENIGQFYENAIPSKIMTCYSYPVRLMNQNEIPIKLTY